LWLHQQETGRSSILSEWQDGYEGIKNVDLGVDLESLIDTPDDDMDPQTAELMVLANLSMDAIESFDDGDSYESLKWDEELVDSQLCIVPTRIYPISDHGNIYLRLWCYLCILDADTESVEVKRATLPLPSRLRMALGIDPDTFVGVRADPLTDSKVLMFKTVYHGLQEYETEGEKRRFHRFGEITLFRGVRKSEHEDDDI